MLGAIYMGFPPESLFLIVLKRAQKKLAFLGLKPISVVRCSVLTSAINKRHGPVALSKLKRVRQVLR
jgi:hypothetical protein